MAAEDGFKVRFIGEDGGLKKTIADLERDLAGFNKQLKNAGSVDALKAAQLGIRKTEADLKSLTKIAGQGIPKMSKDFTGLNRVVQDLPFGFVAISNNLEQILPAAGAAGLAVSALVSALTFASVGFGAWTRGIGGSSESLAEHNKKLNEARAALGEYVNSLDDVIKARVVGTQSAQDEIVKLQTLYAATQNTNISLADRRKLVDELQTQYPKYFANISDETILAGGAEIAYKKLTTSILAAARARAAQDSLVSIQKDLLALEEKQLETEQEQYNAFVKFQQAKKSIGLVTGGSTVGAPAIDNRETIAQRGLNEATAKGNELNKQRNDLLDRAKRLTDEITGIVQTDPNSILDLNGKTLKTKAIKIKPDKIDVEFTPFIADLILPDQFFLFEAAKIQKETQTSFDKYFAKKSSDVTVPLRVDIVAPGDAEKGMKGVLKGIDDLANAVGVEATKAINAALSSGFTSGLAGLGDAIGQALATGADPIQAAGMAIVGTIGDMIQQIGKALIQYGAVKEGLDKILEGGIEIPGVAAIAIGFAAVAIGALLKGAFKKPKGFAAGGLVFGPTMGLVGEGRGTSRSNPEVIAPLDKLKKFIGGGNGQQTVHVVGSIQGKDLVFVMAQNQKSQYTNR